MNLESPTSPLAIQEVDAQHQAARMSLRPWATGVGGAARGHYRAKVATGGMTSATVTSGAPVGAFRWMDPKHSMILTFLEAFWVPTTAFTAAQALGVDAMLASGFTAMDSGGTAFDLSTASRARRTMPPSLFGAGDCQMGTATLLTAGTRTLDALPFVAGMGIVNVVNAAAGTQYLNPGQMGRSAFGFAYEPDMARGEHPIVIGYREGLILRNILIFPAAGVAGLQVNIGWCEVPNELL